MKFLRGSFGFGWGLNIQIISIEPLVGLLFYRVKGQLISEWILQTCNEKIVRISKEKLETNKDIIFYVKYVTQIRNSAN